MRQICYCDGCTRHVYKVRMRNDAMFVEVEPAVDSPDLLSVKEQVLRLGHTEQERLYSWMHYALNHRIYK
jgi:hypothetical protein